MGFSQIFFSLFLLYSVNFLASRASEFNVGGNKGWVVHTVKDDQFYNQWAGKNRFKVNDTLRFEYKKDSVLVVTKEEYEKCKWSDPIFSSNNGKCIYKLEKPGLYYFISGVSGHCERGLKMMIKVLEPAAAPPQSAEHTSAPTIADANLVNIVIGLLIVGVILSYFISV